jgi:alpha-glucosidase (family GH31 glycosyl hydrolase)
MGDLFFMSGETADKAVGLLHTVLGKPVLVPQWALGWN